MAKQSRSEESLVFRQKLGERIKALRGKANDGKNMGQDQFAADVGIHRTHVRLIEKAKVDIRVSTLFDIATQLGITVSELTDIPMDELG